jgi:hypothetical protein
MSKDDANHEIKEDNYLGKEDNLSDVKEFPEDGVKETFASKEDNKLGQEENEVDGKKREKEEEKKKSEKDSSKDNKAGQQSSKVTHGIVAGISTAAIAIVAYATVIAPGSFFGIGGKAPTIEAKINVDEGHLYYFCGVTNPQNIPLNISISGLTTSYSKSIDVTKDGDYASFLSDLKENSSYSFKVVGKTNLGDKTYFSQDFKTGEFVPIEHFYSFTWDCHCTIDGYAYYSLGYIDDMSYWTDLYITITDQAEKSISDTWSVPAPYKDVLHKVDVSDTSKFPGGSYTMDLHATSSDPNDLASGESSADKILYTITVKI